MKMNSKFSLIIATIKRTKELNRLFDSLVSQSYKNFEVIIVDQNVDNRVAKILESYSGIMSILHLHSEPGLSRARNLGMNHITGDIIAFPDDDCWYPENLLEKVAEFFTQNPRLDGVTGCCFDEFDKPSATSKWDYNPGIVTSKNVWQRAISISIFLRKSVIESVKTFDESLGAGANTPWGSGEETDYLLRVIKNGFKVYYNPSLFVYHPQPVKVFDEKSINRAYRYGGGKGRVLRKHSYSVFVILHELIRSFGGAVLSLIKIQPNKARYYWAAFQGKLKGWLAADLSIYK